MREDRPEIVVRDARPDELDEIAAVLSASYAEYAPDQASVSPELFHAWQEYFVDIADVHARLDEGSELIVAERHGRILGTVTFYPEGSRTEGEGWPPDWAGIRLLGVRPDARGLGLGRLLTEECLRRARERGVRTVGLHTTHLMAVARGMYERMGFERVPEYDFHPAPEITVMGYRLDL